MRTTSDSSPVDEVVDAWRAGAVAPRGMRNPAGSLYIGGPATERGLTEIDVAAQTCGTVCSISRTRMCC
ncbi:hypothetical protein EHYA_03666 [Embleya hyalina]|uniref:Uncharacterized protein n=2 Tax=Embleya hyalina TaxID=516124 RepID=A0A401YMZ2_9ACTN|nr:hypothetical protein EHYA_03666 [Embleya hyalina]